METYILKEEIETVNRLSEKIKSFEELVIDWEIDVNKIDTSMLINSNSIYGRIKGIVYEEPPQERPGILSEFDFLDFALKLKEKPKIIPPFKHHFCEIENGKRTLVKNEYYSIGCYVGQIARLKNLKTFRLSYSRLTGISLKPVQYCLN